MYIQNLIRTFFYRCFRKYSILYLSSCSFICNPDLLLRFKISDAPQNWGGGWGCLVPNNRWDFLLVCSFTKRSSNASWRCGHAADGDESQGGGAGTGLPCTLRILFIGQDPLVCASA